MKRLPDLLTLRHRCPLFHSSVHSSVHLLSFVVSKFDIYVKVSILINYNSTTPIIPCMTSCLGKYIDPVTFNISSTIKHTTIKPCKVLHLNVLTRQIPGPDDLDLYFGCSDFDIIYVNIPDLLKCKTSSHQTLHSASPRCTESAGILTR